MDARQQRTRSHLRSAILDLAARRPVGELTAAEVARTAGITRDTFYRHAASPTDLLVDVLRQEVDRIELTRSAGATDFLDAVRQLVEHVAVHAPVYRAALVDGSEGRVRDVLHDAVAARLDDFLQANPAALPHVPDGLPHDVTRAVLVAHCAAGTAAAITEWLRRDADEAEIPALTRTILAAGPQWWLRESGAPA